MRWDNLTLSDESAQDALFGVGDVITRTFDTPEFRGMTFYEVRARSILNKVPGGSRMPFEWTVNPYRGGSHACRYCLLGDTPILMADARAKPLADLPRRAPVLRSRSGGRSSRARPRRAPGSACVAHSPMREPGAEC